MPFAIWRKKLEITPHIDLRITKTKRAIQETFVAMICEMDYREITVKELAARAQINRKTFYSHYLTLDDLLGEMQGELVEGFIKRTSSFKGLSDIAAITKEFFLYTADHDVLKQRLLCYDAYRFIADKIKTILRMNQNNKANSGHNNLTDNIVAAFLASSILETYHQWVIDGRKIPIEEIIEIATQLISHGIASLKK
jgi:AcrR family transcriptional regulator